MDFSNFLYFSRVLIVSKSEHFVLNFLCLNVYPSIISKNLALFEVKMVDLVLNRNVIAELFIEHGVLFIKHGVFDEH